ncbi:hypothetical protein C0J52_15102 [Blattella germanica]|nr:hypothetical protein C0J52_15102 [Blattella germanica]
MKRGTSVYIYAIKKIIKICINKKNDYSTCRISKEFNLLNIKQTYIYTLLKYYHKYNIYYDHGYRTRGNTITHPIF